MGRAAGSALLLLCFCHLMKPRYSFSSEITLLTKLLLFPMLKSNSPSFSHHVSPDEQHLITELVLDTAEVKRCCKSQIDH